MVDEEQLLSEVFMLMASDLHMSYKEAMELPRPRRRQLLELLDEYISRQKRAIENTQYS